MLNICWDYTVAHEIVFNCNKTVGEVFHSKTGVGKLRLAMAFRAAIFVANKSAIIDKENYIKFNAIRLPETWLVSDETSGTFGF